MLPFVCDGQSRAEQGIRDEIEAKYSEQLKAADRAEQERLRKQIDQEIRQRLTQQAPPRCLY